MPTLIERPTRIEAAGTKPKLIDEYVGRVNSGTEAVSVAHMRSPSGWVEPGQTPEFDEVTLVLRGTVRVEHRDGVLDVDDRYVASVAWNVGASTGAGEDLAAAFQRMRPLLDRAPLVLRGLDEATLEALFAAVPDLEEAAAQRRVLVLLDGPGPAAG